jgi:hypothetical protein
MQIIVLQFSSRTIPRASVFGLGRLWYITLDVGVLINKGGGAEGPTWGFAWLGPRSQKPRPQLTWWGWRLALGGVALWGWGSVLLCRVSHKPPLADSPHWALDLEPLERQSPMHVAPSRRPLGRTVRRRAPKARPDDGHLARAWREQG